jgi:hypothetical protein
MRKLFWLMMSLDGLMVGSDRELDRHVTDDEFAAYVAEMGESIDTIAFSGVTCEAKTETINTASLQELNGRTTMTITVLYCSRDRDAVLMSGAERDGAGGFDRLEEILKTTR